MASLQPRGASFIRVCCDTFYLNYRKMQLLHFDSALCYIAVLILLCYGTNTFGIIVLRIIASS